MLFHIIVRVRDGATFSLLRGCYALGRGAHAYSNVCEFRWLSPCHESLRGFLFGLRSLIFFWCWEDQDALSRPLFCVSLNNLKKKKRKKRNASSTVAMTMSRVLGRPSVWSSIFDFFWSWEDQDALSRPLFCFSLNNLKKKKKKKGSFPDRASFRPVERRPRAR